jgi:hypothetical protein
MPTQSRSSPTSCVVVKLLGGPITSISLHCPRPRAVHLGHADAAFLAIREALRVAQEGDDELLHAAFRMSVSWQLLVQGRYEESERVAVVAANSVEPRGDASDSHISAYGLLVVTAATAAARAQKRDSARELLDSASEMARLLGYDRVDHQTTFGPAKVAMLGVDTHVVQDGFVEALTAAKALPRDGDLPMASRARHLADIALAHLRLNHYDRALQTTLAMEQLAPDWIRCQTLPRQIVADLIERERRVSPQLRDLALRIGATTG